MENSFAHKLKELNVSKKAVEEKLLIPRRTLNNWLAGERTPAEWQQQLILYAIMHIDNKDFINDLKGQE